jgi:hypothetical protein
MAKSYRITSKDNALTVPGRVTYPRGTRVTQPPKLPKLPTSNYYDSERNRTTYNPAPTLPGMTSLSYRPYNMSTGTQASGLSGSQGAPFAMSPTRNQYGGAGSVPYGPTAPTPGGPSQQWINQQHNPLPGYGTDDSWFRPVAPVAQTLTPPVLQPGQFVNPTGAVQQGATPFGTNAYGERLDASGNVWSPDTATKDIYGGEFIQAGAVRWERNKKGRLIKVQYGKGGKKRTVAGGKGQSLQQAAEPEPVQVAQPVQQTVQLPSIATAFVSFRA